MVVLYIDTECNFANNRPSSLLSLLLLCAIYHLAQPRCALACLPIDSISLNSIAKTTVLPCADFTPKRLDVALCRAVVSCRARVSPFYSCAFAPFAPFDLDLTVLFVRCADPLACLSSNVVRPCRRVRHPVQRSRHQVMTHQVCFVVSFVVSFVSSRLSRSRALVDRSIVCRVRGLVLIFCFCCVSPLW